MKDAYREYTRTVKASAQGQWVDILPALAGLDSRQVNTKSKSTGVPCPNCGGNDRYSFKSAVNGDWACRHCGGGDGFSLLQKLNGWSFWEAVKAVGEYLHLDPTTGSTNSQERLITAHKQAQQRLQAVQQQSQQEAKSQAELHFKRACYAQALWDNSAPADPTHPYLQTKRLPPLNLRQTEHPIYGWCLLVPLINEQGQIMNLEQINPEGIKRPIKDGKKKGLYYRIGQSSYTVYIAEGWATAAAIHEAKPCKPVVLAAMSSNNLEAVTGIACRIFTENSIVIAADNDEAGRQAAISAASRYDLKIIIPEQEGQDFWDVFSAKRMAGSKSNA